VSQCVVTFPLVHPCGCFSLSTDAGSLATLWSQLYVRAACIGGAVALVISVVAVSVVAVMRRHHRQSQAKMVAAVGVVPGVDSESASTKRQTRSKRDSTRSTSVSSNGGTAASVVLHAGAQRGDGKGSGGTCTGSSRVRPVGASVSSPARGSHQPTGSGSPCASLKSRVTTLSQGKHSGSSSSSSSSSSSKVVRVLPRTSEAADSGTDGGALVVDW
jgi:hypothetical protein